MEGHIVDEESGMLNNPLNKALDDASQGRYLLKATRFNTKMI